jgi:hypothetical protein
MTLQVVKSGTNWSPSDLKVLQRMKANYAEMDERSGRPWKIGDDLLLIAPAGPNGAHNPERVQVIRDAAQYVGAAPGTLLKYGWVSEAWTPLLRGRGVKAGVSYSVFQVLGAEPDRDRILDRLMKDKAPRDIRVDDARGAIERALTRPQSLADRAETYRTYLAKFRGERLTAKSRLALEQLRLEIDVLLGEAEEEAV